MKGLLYKDFQQIWAHTAYFIFSGSTFGNAFFKGSWNVIFGNDLTFNSSSITNQFASG